LALLDHPRLMELLGYISSAEAEANTTDLQLGNLSAGPIST
jgi:hypothetical protein